MYMILHVQDFSYHVTSQTFRPNIEFYLKALSRLMHESLYAHAFKIIGIRV